MGRTGSLVRHDELDPRCFGEVELAQALRSELAQAVECRLALGGQAADIDAKADRRKLGRLVDAVGQELQRPGVIAALCVEEPDADLQDALIETADGPGLGMPLVLDGLMALVIFTLVEESDSFQQPGRGTGLARRAALLENVSQRRIEETARRLDPRQVVANDPL